MAYEKTIWTNRVVEKPRTFIIKNNTDGTVTLVPAEGQVFEAGTPIIAKNMNKIEDAIESLDNTRVIVSSSEPPDLKEGQLWFNIII